MLDAAALQADVAQHLVVEALDLTQRPAHLELEPDFFLDSDGRMRLRMATRRARHQRPG